MEEGHLTMSRFANYILLSVSLLLSIVTAELIARNLAISSGWGTGVQAKNWLRKYWKPINSLGYRDIEPDLSGGSKSIVIVGDSFTAGHGVKLEETSAAQLRRLITADYQVINLGRNGANTVSEYTHLQKLPITPRILVLQYFGNDIQTAAEREGFKLRLTSLRELVHAYHIPTVVYDLASTTAIGDMIFRLLASQKLAEEYFSYFLYAYNNDHVFQRHIDELKSFADYCRARGCDFYALIYPYLDSSAEAAKLNSIYIPKVRAVLKKMGARIIDVDRLSLAMPYDERVVSRNDGHPSPKLHRIVAETIYHHINMRRDRATDSR
jgi:lysophospholipase L1-like esterase